MVLLQKNKMNNNYIGEITALATAVCWTATAIAFAAASRKIGSLTVNLLRLLIGFSFIGIYTQVTQGHFFPIDATTHNWIWLLFSGLIGFVFGDMCLFHSYVLMDARFSQLIMSLAPPIAALTGLMLMGEKMSMMGVLGMLVTLVGIAMVVLTRGEHQENGEQKIKIRVPLKGLLLAFGGAVGQGVGIVLSKYGMQGTQNYNPFSATQIRIIAGILGFILINGLSGKLKEIPTALKNRKAMGALTIGSFFGPFLGVSLSLMAVQYISSGIASTIISIVPVLIIPPAILFFKEKISIMEIIGAIVSVVGVALFFLK